ncbi:GNAT family N-acetyltransferase [Nostoc sp.]|uniref:GNAT family N-acetyltransferase n=1 Tax=Nostoc sp. TaxID=1180 RepID=UPI002FF8BE8F
MALESGYHIRSARAEELPLLSHIECSAARLFLDTPYAFLVDADPLPLDFVQQQFQAGQVWVALDRHEAVVGYTIAREVDGTLYLQQIDVAPEHGRRGIGSALVGTVCTWAKQQGYRIVSLSTFRDIPWNAPFYSKLGFYPVDEALLTTGFQQVRREELKAGLPISERVIMHCVLLNSKNSLNIRLADVEIVTRRFLLRDFVELDRSPFLDYQADPRNLRFYGPDEASPEHATRLFETFQRWAADRPRLNYQLAIVQRQEPDTLIGCCGLRGMECEAGEMELGIELAPTYWGRYAYAIEVGRALLDFGFRELGLEVISGSTVSANARSNRLAEWFGAEVVAIRPGSSWMSARGWNEVHWRIAKEMWERRMAR